MAKVKECRVKECQQECQPNHPELEQKLARAIAALAQSPSCRREGDIIDCERRNNGTLYAAVARYGYRVTVVFLPNGETFYVSPLGVSYTKVTYVYPRRRGRTPPEPVEIERVDEVLPPGRAALYYIALARALARAGASWLEIR